MLNLTLGQVGIAEDIDDSLRFGIEYRLRSFSGWKIIPATGCACALNAANFFYAIFAMIFGWMIVWEQAMLTVL